MRLHLFLSIVLMAALFTNCDDGGKKTTDKCKDVTCGANATCNAGTGECECNTGYTGDPLTGCTLADPCANVTCGDNATCDAGTGECECDYGYIGDPNTGCTLSELCDEVTCGANATCNPSNGECECDEGYIGDPDVGCTLAGTCEANTCNGHGTCDDTGGVVTCDCDTGYTGDFCDACDTANGYAPDPENPGTCVQNPCLPDPCYGHGTCSVELGLPVCDCDEGYTGGNCNRCDTAAGYEDDPENPGSCIQNACFGVTCSGHGTCAVQGGNPVCTCATGYTGATCDTCDTAANYVPSNVTTGACILNPCLGQTCSGHGTCSQSASDTAQCACTTGYTGPLCAGCDTAGGYIASTLSPGTCIPTPCTASACNSHGTCTVVNDAASCACATGWTGPTCSSCATGYTGANCDTCDTAGGYVASTLVPGTCIVNPCAGQTCSGHGTCSVVNDAPSCACTTGYTGPLCAGCDTAGGYVASNATPGTCILDPCAGNTCSGHGTCGINAADAPVCACATGYTGANCGACDTANDYIASTLVPGNCILNPCPSTGACSGHGACTVVNDAASCVCVTGYTGPLCAGCDTANHYIASTVTPGTCIVDPCFGEDCSGHGTCAVVLDLEDCTCDTGYAGDYCDACDTAGGYVEFPVGSGTCVDNTLVQPGDLVITEIMIQSTTSPPSMGQWFEITNVTAGNKRLADLTLWADAATISIPSDSTVVIPAGGSIVVGSNPMTGTNGGVTMEQLIPGIDLEILGGTIEIERTSDTETIDIVTWDSTWNHQSGRTLSLSPAALTQATPAATLNDDGDHWCFGATLYSSMYGTPDLPNDECRVSWCGLQSPATVATEAGTPTALIYGQVYDFLLTMGQDNFNPFITAQVGFGAVDSDPAVGWTWFDAVYNTSFAGEINNEEFMGTLLPTAAGIYDYIYRVSTDGGLSYQNCFWHVDGTSRGELTVTALPACGPQVVISDLYGAGGNANAIWRNDFVVLHNRSITTVANLVGWSIQYASAAGNSWTVLNLSGTIQPGAYYLISLASGGAVGTTLPTPDQSSTSINLGGTAGKLALVSNTIALTGTCPTGGAIVDFVGFGTTANCFETAYTTVVQTATSGLRLGDGCTDTNSNLADFVTSTAAPKNSASPVVTCGCN